MELKRGENAIVVPAIIDTGSTYSLFSGEIAVALGLEIINDRKQKLKTLGGNIEGYPHVVNMEIVDAFVLGEIEVLFAADKLPRNVLGRSDFQRIVDVGFSETTETIYIKRAEE